MAEFPERLRSSTAFLLAQATRQATRLAQRHFGEEPLRFGHYVVMAVIAENDDLAQIELSRLLQADPSDLVTTLDELEKAGLVERSVDTADRRRRLLTITPEGREWLLDRDRRSARYEEELCRNLGDRGTALRRELTELTLP